MIQINCKGENWELVCDFHWVFDKLVISKLFGSDNDYIISPKFNEFSFQEVL